MDICFYSLAIVNNASVNMGVEICLWDPTFNSFGYINWSGIARSLVILGFPGALVGKESACNAGDSGSMGSIPRLGRSPGGEHGNLLQYSCLQDPMDRGALWGYSLWGPKESDMTEVTEHAVMIILFSIVFLCWSIKQSHQLAVKWGGTVRNARRETIQNSNLRKRK